MSLPPPRPLSVSKSPSSGPAAARAATQDAQIAELVQQNRTLEHTISQLRAKLRGEEARGIDAINLIRERWKAERKEWRDGCDSLQEKHRLAHLETRVALEHERGFRLEDRAALIKEKTATLLREYKITLFQAKETELVHQVATLEDELQSLREEMLEQSTKHEAELAQLIFRLSTAEARQDEHDEQYGTVSEEKRALDTELSILRASSASSVKQIDRLSLQIETLRTHISSLETRNKELQHQIGKWQSLEGKGEKEVESLRSRKIELEVRVKELEVNLRESRAMVKKIAKLESSLLETQEQVEQRQQDVSEAQAEAAQAQKQVSRLERQVGKLQAQLEAEKKAKSQNQRKPIKKVGSRAPLAVPEEAPESSDDGFQALPSKSRSRNQRPGPSRNVKTKGKGKNIDNSEDILLSSKKHGEGETHESETHENENGDLRTADSEVADVEMQEVPPPATRNDRRPEQDSSVEEVPLAVKHRKPSTKMAKAKEAADAEDKGRGKKRTKSKPASTAGGHKLSEVDTEEDQPAKKKKRKLPAIGGSSVFGGPAGFTWNQDDGGNLGIPSVLSPVKEGEPVPTRAMSGSLLGGWRGF